MKKNGTGIIDLSDRTDMFYWQTDRNVSPSQIRKIFLDRRRDFNPEEAKRAITYGMTQYGKRPQDAAVVSLGGPITFGSVNNVVRATLADGTEVVIRMHPPGVKNGYFHAERLVADLARGAGVPVYETYFIYDRMEEFPFDFMIMEAMPGKTMQEYWPLPPELESVLVGETGRYAAMIHGISTDGFGFFRNDIAKSENRLAGLYETFSAHIYAALPANLEFLTGHGVISDAQAKGIVHLFKDQADMFSIREPVLVHNDIADWNEVSDGSHITGVIDWDECFSGDPVMDFAQWSLFFDDNRMKHFIRGYESVRPLPERYTEKMHIFRLRYLVSKLTLRQKKLLVTDSAFIRDLMKRGLEVMREEFRYFGIR